MRMYQDTRRLDFHALGREIKRKREAKGWTQEYLAQLVDRTPRSIMYFETSSACSRQKLMVSNVNCGMNLHYPWRMYVIVYVAVLVLYFVMNGLLTSKTKKVNLAEVLKNRE